MNNKFRSLLRLVKFDEIWRAGGRGKRSLRALSALSAKLNDFVDVERCCRVNADLSRSVPIQPKTAEILPKTLPMLVNANAQPCLGVVARRGILPPLAQLPARLGEARGAGAVAAGGRRPVAVRRHRVFALAHAHYWLFGFRANSRN